MELAGQLASMPKIRQQCDFTGPGSHVPVRPVLAVAAVQLQKAGLLIPRGARSPFLQN